MTAARPKRTRQRAGAKLRQATLPETSIKAVEVALGHRFRDRQWLVRAMTHGSATGAMGLASNQRLEFLGDRVLGLVIADWLMERFEGAREGGLARRLNSLVDRQTCAEVMRELDLSRYMVAGESERENGVLEAEGVNADLCEALIAALYRDGGLKPARAFIEKHWAGRIKGLTRSRTDPKTALQEHVLGRRLDLPAYSVVDRTGPDHAPEFRVRVAVHGIGEAEGTGASKQDAERAAAAALLASIAEQAGGA